jgi:hypothetical protein
VDDLPLEWRVRAWLAEHLPRRLAILLAIRRLSPSGLWPMWEVRVAPAVDTGGGYRAKHRRQDPSIDPSEPYGSESSSVGNDHGWSGCTMSSGADAIAYQQPRGSVTPWGGDLRHRGGTDLSGGTDLYDVRSSWAEYGETLTIRTGAGWSGVVKAHDEGRAIIAQGEGNVPGSQTFDGGHACAIAPETHSDGRWLFGDPLASDWQWVSTSSIRSWMENLSSGCYFAVGEAPPDDPEPPKPPPPPPPPPDRYPEGYADGYALGVSFGEATHGDRVFRSWHPGRPIPDDELPSGARWQRTPWGGVIPLPVGEPWAAWPLPLAALYQAQYPAAWADAGWAAAVWRPLEPGYELGPG